MKQKGTQPRKVLPTRSRPRQSRAAEEPLWLSPGLASPALVWRRKQPDASRPAPSSLTSLSQASISSGKGTKGFRQLQGPCRLAAAPWGRLQRLQHPTSHWLRDWVGWGSCQTGFSGTPGSLSVPESHFPEGEPNQALPSSSAQLSQHLSSTDQFKSWPLTPSQSGSRFHHSHRLLAVRTVLGKKDPLWMALSRCSVLGTRILPHP